MDIFNRHAGKVAMANCAQLINCLNSLYLAHEDRFVVTTVGACLKCTRAIRAGNRCAPSFPLRKCTMIATAKAATFWGLSGSASLRGKNLLLTVVNPHVSEPREAEIVQRGAAFSSGTVTTLSHADLRAKNTFDRAKP
jgi:alpha-N-arabinofuranosidase